MIRSRVLACLSEPSGSLRPSTPRSSRRRPGRGDRTVRGRGSVTDTLRPPHGQMSADAENASPLAIQDLSISCKTIYMVSNSGRRYDIVGFNVPLDTL